jgi:DNA-binding MarR family transcriptional regulator
MDVELHDCLPILGYGLFSRGPEQRSTAGRHDDVLPLSALLARVLLAFAMEFERESDLSLAISANVVRALIEQGVLVRDLPRVTGVSKEAIRMALGVLEKRRAAVVEQDAARKAKIARLTPKGHEIQDAYRALLASIEERWRTRFGEDAIRILREALERLVGEPTAQASPLFRGLEPYSDGWRAAVSKPETLPHYPMVLHRGGFPDGS